MRVRCHWLPSVKRWSIVAAGKKIGEADTLLLREAVFLGKRGLVEGDLEAVHRYDGTECGRAVRWYEWDHARRANNEYKAFAGRSGTFVHHNGEAFTAEFSPMVLLTRTNGTVLSRKAAIVAFDPCTMTAEESARATQ